MIRIPLKKVLDYDDSPQTGSSSVSGGVAKRFTIPQDAESIVVKLTASVIAGAVSATLQTTDDGGSTWYDVARTSIVSNTDGAGSILGGSHPNAEWLSVPVAGAGIAANAVVGSVFGTPGKAGASTLGSRQVSGLPILSQEGRIFLQYTAAVSSTDLAQVKVLVNSQDK